MTDKKTILIIVGIISIVIILIAILIGVFAIPKKNETIAEEKNGLYFVIKSEDNQYGICKTDGTIVIKPEYKKIARVDNSVYLKSETDSYLYFLDDGKSVSLGGKESEIYFAYDKLGLLLPYYILRYGDSEQTSIFRIYNNKGIRHDLKDFSSLNDAYKFLDAKEVFKITSPPTEITSIYNVNSSLQYATPEGYSQFIVTKKDKTSSKQLQGLIDEKGTIILDLIYDKITALQDSTYACKVEKDDKTYILLNSGKLVEVETGFEFSIFNGFFMQRKGNTVNKIYNLSGEVVVDGIYNIKEDLTALNSKTGINYILVQEKKDIYSLYNITNNKKSENVYNEVILDYMKSYNTLSKNIAFISKKNSTYYVTDIDTLKSSKMTITNTIYSPLDLGIIYKGN
ncbi:MAG: WG repeat-containing protein [Clostridia bacterium]